ncbi:hypothetical protein EDC40_10363 [Aminobacter aminovorans]|uniref:Uncharacterized protein n=1 Tax=Aminobacter aminovorans TaxID=83263 RepID=A0A380WLS1_AMIAI|nr:hypothetical protein EDC40_10363 [Aminobacter aminovorans]SUU89989.1 Uncharacterised protein [Aminobacter aminovorans]
MSGRNWDKARSRDQIRRHGVDDISDQSAPYIPSGQPPRRRPSKVELRAELERLMAERRQNKGGQP